MENPLNACLKGHANDFFLAPKTTTKITKKTKKQRKTKRKKDKKNKKLKNTKKTKKRKSKEEKNPPLWALSCWLGHRIVSSFPTKFSYIYRNQQLVSHINQGYIPRDIPKQPSLRKTPAIHYNDTPFLLPLQHLNLFFK